MGPIPFLLGAWAVARLGSDRRSSTSLWTVGIALAPLVVFALERADAEGKPGEWISETVLKRTPASPPERVTLRRGQPKDHPAGGTYVATFEDGQTVEWSESEARAGVELLQGSWPD